MLIFNSRHLGWVSKYIVRTIRIYISHIGPLASRMQKTNHWVFHLVIHIILLNKFVMSTKVARSDT